MEKVKPVLRLYHVPDTTMQQKMGEMQAQFLLDQPELVKFDTTLTPAFGTAWGLAIEAAKAAPAAAQRGGTGQTLTDVVAAAMQNAREQVQIAYYFVSKVPNRSRTLVADFGRAKYAEAEGSQSELRALAQQVAGAAVTHFATLQAVGYQTTQRTALAAAATALDDNKIQQVLQQGQAQFDTDAYVTLQNAAYVPAQVVAAAARFVFPGDAVRAAIYRLPGSTLEEAERKLEAAGKPGAVKWVPFERTLSAGRRLSIGSLEVDRPVRVGVVDAAGKEPDQWIEIKRPDTPDSPSSVRLTLGQDLPAAGQVVVLENLDPQPDVVRVYLLDQE